MGSNTGGNDSCGCGSGKKYTDCCGAPKGEVASMRVKDANVFELTPGLADALSASLDASYLEYFAAACSGRSTKEAEVSDAYANNENVLMLLSAALSGQPINLELTAKDDHSFGK
jgi:SEC-C motif